MSGLTRGRRVELAITPRSTDRPGALSVPPQLNSRCARRISHQRQEPRSEDQGPCCEIVPDRPSAHHREMIPAS
ncbi:hypothetical protein SEA_CAMBIARE_63 [Mycobacterium phage Cambiare]|uniref:Uncharacterized protein n=1 Tax=Mycobacterium phage Cambiare TaxID=1647305 RepID=A0A0F6WE85_9CAUD|nr:hypothetical protein AVT48_gp63 [Mycobacterium phage Cambiare]AKF14565.1 hypothetical protein SEA_CAMBIARE_63 [Mycobacterium phage Cambiare]